MRKRGGIIRRIYGRTDILRRRPCAGLITQCGTDIATFTKGLCRIRCTDGQHTGRTVVVSIRQETQASRSRQNECR